MSVVSVSHLSKSYGGRPPALSDVTLEFGEGVTGLLGPNGAGKSTLIQCVLGLLRDYAGEVTVLGLDARRDRLEVRRLVGYMPEADSFLPKMTGVRATRYLAELSGLPYAEALRRAHECLHFVGMTDALYRPGEEYSTGMRQRLKLAQALVHDPQILFVDEPVTGLDPAGHDEFLHLIRTLATDHGKHVVWSSHLLPDVQKVADAVVVLDRGRFRGALRMEELAAETGRYEVEGDGDGVQFSGEVVARGGRVASVASEASAPGDAAPRFRRVASLPGDDGAARLLAAASATRTRLRRVSPVVESLEEAFHRLLGDGVARRDGGAP